MREEEAFEAFCIEQQKKHHSDTFDEERARRQMARGFRVLPVCLDCFEQHDRERINCEDTAAMQEIDRRMLANAI